MDELVQGLVAVVVNAVQELQHDEVPLSELLARAHPADVDGPLLVAGRRVHHEDAEVLAERLEIIGPVAERVQLGRLEGEQCVMVGLDLREGAYPL